jgi:hypothetical protein
MQGTEEVMFGCARNRSSCMPGPLPLIEVAAGTVLYRLTRVRFPDPAYFGCISGCA